MLLLPLCRDRKSVLRKGRMMLLLLQSLPKVLKHPDRRSRIVGAVVLQADNRQHKGYHSGRRKNMKRTLLMIAAAAALLFGLTAFAPMAEATPHKFELALDDQYHDGKIADSGEDSADEWKFTITKPGYLKVYVMSTGLSCGEIKIRNEERTSVLASDSLSRGSENNPAVKWWGMRVMPGTLWFDVYAINWGDGPYKIRAAFSENDTGEPEPNNSFTQAAAFAPNVQMNGQICINDMYDYYKITVPAEQEVWVYLYTNAPKAELRIFDSDFIRVTEQKITRNSGDYASEYTWKDTLKAGSYYVQVAGEAGNSYTAYESWLGTGVYRLKWGGSLMPVKVSALSLSRTSGTVAAGKTLALSYTAAPSDAWNTAVKWSSSNRSVAKVTSGGVVKGIKPGTAVITAVTADGSNISASCTVTVKPGKGKIKAVSGGKKSLTVTWKKQAGVKGYQLQYSRDRKFRNNTVKAVKASKTAAKIKKLAKKKTYYVRLRSYAVINGTTYYGSWSKAAKAKTK